MAAGAGTETFRLARQLLHQLNDLPSLLQFIEPDVVWNINRKMSKFLVDKYPKAQGGGGVGGSFLSKPKKKLT